MSDERIRQVIAANGGLPVSVTELSVSDDLFAAGMSSHASVNVMLALESEFEIAFPDEMLNRSNFQSISAIRDSISQLGSRTVAGFQAAVPEH